MKNQKIRNFRDLLVWQLGKEICLTIYKAVSSFPKNETYGLCDQLKKSAVSIPSNIAEGFNRFHNKEYRQFLFIALGSCSELETQIEISRSLKFIPLMDADTLLKKLNEEQRMIWGLIKKL